MACQTIHRDTPGVLCIGDQVYDFGGFIFEIHHYHGPCPLHRQNLTPRKLSEAFWSVWDSFEKLDPQQQAAFAVADRPGRTKTTNRKDVK